MEISERIYNGNRAKEVLENESFQWAIDSIKNEVTEQWKQSPVRDLEGREKLWMMLQLANKLESVLKTSLETGTLAQLDLKHQRTLQERAKLVKDAIFSN
jgi:hypothetical protein